MTSAAAVLTSEVYGLLAYCWARGSKIIYSTRARHRFVLERKLAQRPGAPSYWRNDVEGLLLHKSLSVAADDVGGAGRRQRGPRDAFQLPHALDAWVEIWAYCRQARARGDRRR